MEQNQIHLEKKKNYVRLSVRNFIFKFMTVFFFFRILTILFHMHCGAPLLHVCYVKSSTRSHEVEKENDEESGCLGCGDSHAVS